MSAVWMWTARGRGFYSGGRPGGDASLLRRVVRDWAEVTVGLCHYSGRLLTGAGAEKTKVTRSRTVLFPPFSYASLTALAHVVLPAISPP